MQRFLPSEFGNDVDRSNAVEPAKSAFGVKVQIRRAVEAAGIPYTYVSANFFAGYFLPSLSQPGASVPPRDKIVILGDGTPLCNYSLPFFLTLPSFITYSRFITISFMKN